MHSGWSDVLFSDYEPRIFSFFSTHGGVEAYFSHERLIVSVKQSCKPRYVSMWN